jgi:capsular exopolysaccharide synthesis family protein
MTKSSNSISGSNDDFTSTPSTEIATVRRPYSEQALVSQRSNGNETTDEGEGWGILEIWRSLLQRKVTWILFAFTGAVIGFLYTLPQIPIYQAYTSLEIVALNDNFMNLGRMTPNDTGAAAASDVQTQIKILQSASIMRGVIQKLVNQEGPIRIPPTRYSAWRRALNLSDPTGSAATAQLIGQAAGSLQVHASDKTRVVEITVDSPSPKLAADFLNVLADEFIQHNLESRWKSTEKASEWLGHQLDDMRIKLEKSEDSLQQYARDSGLIFTDEKKNVSEEKLVQLQAELSKATTDRIAKQSRYELAQSSAPDDLPDIINDESLRGTQDSITDIRRQLADLSPLYTPNYSKVKRLQAELDTLKEAFEHDRSAILGRIRSEFNEASRREKLLQTAYEAQVKEVSGEGERSIQYNILKREADSNRMLYDAMLSQLKQSSIASAMRASNVSVVDAATIPRAPYKPDTKNNSLIGMLAGTFLGAAFIILRHRVNKTIQQPGDAVGYLNIPELGIIPSGKLELARMEAASSSDRPRENVELATWQFKPSAIAEGFRATLVSMLFATRSASTTKVFVLASGSPGEGKSTITSNLAIAIAEVGQSVLIIDADLRRPRQHDIFSVSNDLGLSNILREKSSLNGDRSLGGSIRETNIPGLYLLPSGPGTLASTNLLYGPHLTALLNYVRGLFDVVLIDTPPMLQMADARVIAGLADAAVLVIRAGQTTRDAAMAAMRLFQQDGSKVLGTILNDWDPKTSLKGYYGYNGKYYSHSTYYAAQKN